MAKNPYLYNRETILRYIQYDEVSREIDDHTIMKMLHQIFETSDDIIIKKKLRVIFQDDDSINRILEIFNYTLMEFIEPLVRLYPEIFTAKIIKCIQAFKSHGTVKGQA